VTRERGAGAERAPVALVTGGGAGIGQAISIRLAQDGMTVVVADLDLGAAEATAEEIRRAWQKAEAIALDAADAGSIAAVFAEVERRLGGCDVLVNNAGIAKTFPFLDFPLDNWSATINVNVTGAMLCAQHAARAMKRKGWGRIVNIASVSGVRASGGRTAYGTSKAALIGLTRQMAVELAAHGITANAVAPGPVDTPLARTSHSAIIREQYVATIPMARYGTPAEIAAAVSFLASHDSSYVTGHVLAVDGGYLAAGLRDP
jgi:NAD(P)-dependent dehydrogenase (short-subunit alcohol dehydrogenase family)